MQVGEVTAIVFVKTGKRHAIFVTQSFNQPCGIKPYETASKR
jgi:hypothetical protein